MFKAINFDDKSDPLLLPTASVASDVNIETSWCSDLVLFDSGMGIPVRDSIPNICAIQTISFRRIPMNFRFRKLRVRLKIKVFVCPRKIIVIIHKFNFTFIVRVVLKDNSVGRLPTIEGSQAYESHIIDNNLSVSCFRDRGSEMKNCIWLQRQRDK